MLSNKHTKIISEFGFISILLLLFKIIYNQPEKIPTFFIISTIIYALLIIITLTNNYTKKQHVPMLLVIFYYVYTFINLLSYGDFFEIILVLHLIGLFLTIIVFSKINFIFLFQFFVCLIDNIYGSQFTSKEILMYYTVTFALSAYISYHFAITYKELNEKIELLSKTDDFTELLNQKGFLEKLENEYHRSARYNKSFALLMIDSDGLKKINDTHGHKYGSMTIKMIADIIKSYTRRTDFAGRYGGDEFMVCLVESTKEDGMIFAERLRKTVEMKSLFTDKGKELEITISVGVSCYPDSGKELYDVIENADKALYKAKNKGKNSVAFL